MLARTRMDSSARGRAHVASRVAASLLGSYLFVWGFMSVGVGLSVASGMRYAEAEQMLRLIAFLVFLGCFCWAFLVRSLVRLWSVLAGAGAAMVGAGWLLARVLL